MARPSKLSALSVNALLQLRDDVAVAISRKTVEMQQQLAVLTGSPKAKKNGAVKKQTAKRHALKGRTVTPKYRNPGNPSQTWAGRGLQPVWLRDLLKQGRELAEFAIAAGARTTKGRKGRRSKPAADQPA